MSIGRVPGATGIQPSIVDAKGDLIVATAADSVSRLAVGTNEQRLVADSATATGLKYVADTTNYAIAAKGDLLVGTGADTLAALTVGTNGHTLVADSATATGLKWAAPASGSTFAGCLIYNSASQTINNATNTVLNFDQEEFDTDGFHSTTTNTSRITIPSGKGGYYWVRAHYAPLDNAAGVRFVYIYKNGGIYYEGGQLPWATYGGHADVAGIVPLAVGDYVEMRVFQTSGGSLGTNAANPYYTTFSAYYIGA